MWPILHVPARGAFHFLLSFGYSCVDPKKQMICAPDPAFRKSLSENEEREIK